MAESELSRRERRWFDDARGIDRRLGVSTHADLGLIVLSLWTGETCTATFQLPVTEAPRVIGTLADGLADGIPNREPVIPVVRPPRWRNRVTRLLHVGRRRTRRSQPGPDATGPHLTLVRTPDER